MTIPNLRASSSKERRVSAARILFAVALAGVVLGVSSATLPEELTVPEPASTVEEQLQRMKAAGIPTTLEELRLRDITDEQNGAVVYREAFELLEALSEKYRKELEPMPDGRTVGWHELRADEKEKLLNLFANDVDFRELFRLLEKASQMECSFLTKEDYGKAPDTLAKEGFRHLAKFRDFARMLAAKAQQQAQNGQTDLALQTVLTGFRTAKSLRDEPFLISQLVRVAIDGIALASLEDVLNQGQASNEIQRSLMDEVADERRTNIAQYALQGELVAFGLPSFERSRRSGYDAARDEIVKFAESEEYLRGDKMDLTAILRVLREKGPEKFWHDEELVYLRMISELLPIAGRPYWEVRQELERLAAQLQGLPDAEQRGVLAGRTLAQFCNICPVEARFDAWLGAAEIALALRIYKAKNGFYPSVLSAIVPEIIPELPKDPFTGKDFVYNPKGTTIFIYSLGENLRDDLGVSHEEKHWRGDYDIVWKLSYF
jgi:hypothetical protein